MLATKGHSPTYKQTYVVLDLLTMTFLFILA